MAKSGESHAMQHIAARQTDDPAVPPEPVSKPALASTDPSSQANNTLTSDVRQDSNVEYGPIRDGMDRSIPSPNAGLDECQLMPGGMRSWLNVAQLSHSVVPLGMYDPGGIGPHDGSHSWCPPTSGASATNLDTTVGNNFDNVLAPEPINQDGGSTSHNPNDWWAGFVAGLGFLEGN